MRALLLLVCAVAAALLQAGCEQGRTRLHKETRAALYTVVSITVAAHSEAAAGAAMGPAFDEMERVAALLNSYDEHSEISRVNRNAGIAPQPVSPETLEVVTVALHVADLTDGAFDVTIGPVVRLWDFKNKVIPDKNRLRQALAAVGYRHVLTDTGKGTVFLARRGMQIDLGGILKGYAADRAVAVLKEKGIASGIVAVGGEVRAFGRRPDGEKWNVGIRNPRSTGSADEILATVRLSDRAISTSGDYEKYFESEGTRYHHILDPRTGYPVSECLSVSVVAPESVMADALSTALFVAGPDKGLRLLKQMGLDGVIVDSHGNIHITDGVRAEVDILAGRK